MKRSLSLFLAISACSLLFSQACDSLFSPCVTTFSRQGFYFDLEAVNQVEVNGFSIMAQNPGTRDMAVYYRAGTYFGNEGNAPAWTLLGNQVGFTPLNGLVCPINPSPLSIPFSVCIPQGQRYGFYVTMSAGTGSLESSNNLAEGSIGAQDANLQLITGKGQFGVGLFAGTLLSGLTFQGTIQYLCTCTPTGVLVEAPLQEEIRLYPVPATNVITIKLPNTILPNCRMEIFDLTGRAVFVESPVLIPGAEVTLDISFLSPGFYTLLLRNGNEVLQTGNFIRE